MLTLAPVYETVLAGLCARHDCTMNATEQVEMWVPGGPDGRTLRRVAVPVCLDHR